MRERLGPAYRLPADDLMPTARQLDIARYLSHGLTEPMTAEALCLSLHTVKTHTRSLRYRMGAKTTEQAVCDCIRRGLID